MKADIEKYRHHMDQFDIPEHRKEDCIHTVWKMLESSVDRAFDLDSVQLARMNQLSKRALGSTAMIEFRKAANGVFEASPHRQEREEK